jgi:hypothetical protein
VNDIPGFPARDLSHLRDREAREEVSLGVDFTTANRLSIELYGAGYAVFNTVLSWVPWLLALAGIGIAVWLNNYWYLLGTLLSLLGPFLANPYNPISRAFKLIALLAVPACIGLALVGSTTAGVLLAAFTLSFWSTWLMYHANQERLRRNALSDEALFLALFQDGKLGIRVKDTDQTIWGPVE